MLLLEVMLFGDEVEEGEEVSEEFVVEEEEDNEDVGSPPRVGV